MTINTLHSIDENMTLQQGLMAFQRKNEKYFSKRTMSVEAEKFLKCHDIAHVVFQCNTSIYGEGLVKIWTSFGSTESFWQIIKGYQEVSAFQLFKQYSLGHFLKNIFKYLIVIPKAIIRTKKMTKPWPFYNYEPYLNMSLIKIRNEFNIMIIPEN